VLNLNVPPLRDRKEDIPLLIEHFRSLFFQKTGIYKDINDDVFQILESYYWPGNVRELKNIVFRLLVIAEGDRVTKDLVPEEIISEIMNGMTKQVSVDEIEKPDVTLSHILKDIEAKVIHDTLLICGQNKSKAADMLGIQRMTLYRKLKELGIES
jgi:DNA-binding NtrC family response regulator